ncbi:amino acid permease/ SLC12A domain-containing protein [Xylaria venustula]|nr:amino acid permease/ SLC12A domain-containing protein [Xylaria venustula]
MATNSEGDAIMAVPTAPKPVPTSLQKVITTRQFVLMALSSSIGAGLLLSTGQALAVGGPAPLLIAFAVVGLAVWITMCNLGELSTNFPVKGSFYEYSVRFISPGWGFAMGWNYVVNLVFIVPFEIIVIIMCMHFWSLHVSTFVLIPVFILGLAVIYSFGARFYAEAENIFGALKIIVIAIFVATALAILARSVPTDTRPVDRLALETWQTGAFLNGAPGFLFAFATAGIAYGGTEMLGLTAGECRSPQRVMLASGLVAVRVVLLYLLPVLMLGLVLTVDPGPTTASKSANTTKELISPFVVAVSQANIPVLPDLMNAIIIVAIFSMANATSELCPTHADSIQGRKCVSKALAPHSKACKSRSKRLWLTSTVAVFASSRALQAICTRGMGPAFCARLYRNRPLGALAVVFAFSLLSFAKATPHGDEVFVWLLSLASCSNYLTWCSICIAQVRCRLALKRQGRSFDNPDAYRSPVGIAGSLFAIGIFVFGLAAQITAAAQSPLSSPPPVSSSFMGLLVVVVFWVGYLAWKPKDVLLVPLDRIDLGPKEPVPNPLSAVGTGYAAV